MLVFVVAKQAKGKQLRLAVLAENAYHCHASDQPLWGMSENVTDREQYQARKTGNSALWEKTRYSTSPFFSGILLFKPSKMLGKQPVFEKNDG